MFADSRLSNKLSELNIIQAAHLRTRTSTCVFHIYNAGSLRALSHPIFFPSFCFLVRVAYIYLFFYDDPEWPIAIRSTRGDFWFFLFFSSLLKRAFFGNERVFGWKLENYKKYKTRKLYSARFSRVSLGILSIISRITRYLPAFLGKRIYSWQFCIN